MNKMTFGLSAEKATVAKDTIASAIQPLIHLLIDILLGICFRREDRGNQGWAEYMGKKGG